MKLNRFCVARLVLLVLACVLMMSTGLSAVAGELKLEAQLIWGTNDKKSPNPDHKPVDPEVEKRLKKLPFKWQNYFEVNRKQFAVAEGDTKKVVLSKDCEIKVRNLGKGVVEVHLFGKGELVSKISQSLPKGEWLVTGGNAANLTSWFVVLRQVD